MSPVLYCEFRHVRQGSVVREGLAGPKASRPPHIIRHGEALAPCDQELGKALKGGETLEQSHNGKSTLAATPLYAVDEATEQVR